MGNSNSNTSSDDLTEDQWMNLVKQSRKNKFNARDDYELFIQYLVNPQTISNDIISNITRIIRHYIATSLGVTLCDFSNINSDKNNNIKFDGVKVSIAIHPINGDIYIADEFTIFKLINNNKLKVITTRSSLLHLISNIPRITDLTFNYNGNMLFCMLDNNLSNVFKIDYKNGDIFENAIYDKMNIFKYDFNHYYLTDPIFMKMFPNEPIPNTPKLAIKTALSRIWEYSSLYVTNFYKNEIWILRNRGNVRSPILYRIAMNNKDILEKINLENDVINFKEKVYTNNTIDGNISNRDILAFDVDKYYKGIYIVTSNKVICRIERLNTKWKVTHTVLLKDALNNNLPLGIHTIRYDSIVGRIIIADNYKLQSIYL